LVDLGLATRDQIAQCLAAPADQRRPFPRLSQLLIDQGILSPGQLEGSVVARAAEDPENRIGACVLVGNLRAETWKAWDTNRRGWVELTFVGAEELGGLQARAKVVHPALAAILDFGSAEGRNYVVMESIAGIRLAAAPRSDRRPLIEAVRDAANGVAALHSKKLFHGAISPETLFLDAGGRGRVAGWGSRTDDVRALAAALYEALTDRTAPNTGTPKTWPKRLDRATRAVFAMALGSRRCTASALAEGLTATLRRP
ncbi:MAG TPA: hypothetical protein VMU54_12920, partial [Planctomycetota bacterium]|nr:hypothetical protein [Planctomycetota bacterium]